MSILDLNFPKNKHHIIIITIFTARDYESELEEIIGEQVMRGPLEYIQDQSPYGYRVDRDGLRICAYMSVHQILPEDEYGGFIEDYFSVDITMYYDIKNGLFNVYVDMDSSHAASGFMDRIFDYVAAQIKSMKTTVFGVEQNGMSEYDAAKLVIKIMKLFENLAISKKRIWHERLSTN